MNVCLRILPILIVTAFIGGWLYNYFYLRNMDLALEEMCDNILKYIYGSERLNSNIISLMSNAHGLNYHQADIDKIFSILITDGFVINKGRRSCEITDRGIAFIQTDSYVERKKRWVIENKIKTFTYKYRWVSWVISGIALMVSIFSIYITTHHKNTTTQILLLPEKEKKMELPKLDTLNMRDTLYKK